jgi:hypothetical protein
VALGQVFVLFLWAPNEDGPKKKKKKKEEGKKIRECETITPGFCCCCFCFYDTPPIKSTFTGTRDPDRSHVSQSNLIKRPTPRREKGAHDTPKERERGGERTGRASWVSGLKFRRNA